jgi:hypothetical protein
MAGAVPADDLPGAGASAVPADDLPGATDTGGGGGPQQQPEAPHPLGPWASAAVRPVAEGAAALPMMAMDTGVAVRNILGDAGRKALGWTATPDYEMPSQMFQKALDEWTTKPEGIGKAAEFVNSALAGGFTNPTGVGIKALDEVPAQLGRQAVMREAHQVGYDILPSEAGHAPTAALEGVSGSARLSKEISAKNVEDTQRLVKTALGLHPDHPPLSPQVLEAIRDEQSKPYEALRMLGEVKTDDEFMNDVAGAGADFSKIDRAFPKEPGAAPAEGSGVDASQIEQLKGKYFQPRFTSGEAIDAMKQLRKDAATNLKVYDPNKNALGMVQRQISDAFEARLERQAEQTGNKGLVDQLRKARVRIAQTYAVEDAMNKATGQVSAALLGKLFQNGATLTDELQTVARTAIAFPQSMKDVAPASGNPFTVVDFLVAAGGYAHNPALLSAIVARPGIRKALQTKIAQRMATAGPTATGQAIQQAAPGMMAGANQTLQ